jgi:hypothetical protein
MWLLHDPKSGAKRLAVDGPWGTEYARLPLDIRKVIGAEHGIQVSVAVDILFCAGDEVAALNAAQAVSAPNLRSYPRICGAP